MREVILELHICPNWKSKILSKIFPSGHVWSKVCDFKIGQDESFVYDLIIWRCTDCEELELWIVKERKGI